MTDPLAEIKSAMYEAQYEAAVHACLESLIGYYLSRCPEELREQVIEGSIRTIRDTVKLYGELGR